jgi:hypothetical protein
METNRPTSRRTLWVVLGCVVLLGALAWHTLQRWEALGIMESEEGVLEHTGFEGKWKLPFESEAKWVKLLPNARLRRVYLNGWPENGARLGRAVRTCGPLEELDIQGSWDQGLDQFEAFLEAMGRQPAMRSVETNMLSLPAEAIPRMLARFPNLRSLRLVEPYSGAGFPLLAKLEEVDLPQGLTDEGLAAILRCPRLASVYAAETKITSAALREIPQRRPKTLKKLYIHAPNLKVGEDREIMAWLKTVCPDLECKIDGPDDPQASTPSPASSD